MEITLALLADASNVSRDGKLNILGAFDRIWAVKFPANHTQMELVIRFECSHAELGQTKTLKIVLLDADGRELGQVEGPLRLPPKGSPFRQINHAIRFQNTQFNEPGVYEFAILVDGDQKRTVPLTLGLIEREPQSDGQP